jgi:hypothetical protein
VKNWIYFATSEKASLASTIETVINAQFLWRSAFNEKDARIVNVGGIREGDHVVVAWRHSSVTRTAYLECTVAEPLSPVAPGLVIDKLAGPSAQILVSAGYPQNSAGEVESVRLDDIRECYFQVQGKYGGNNAIHTLAVDDVGQLSKASTIPPEALIKHGDRIPKHVSGTQIPPPTLMTSVVDQVNIQSTTASRAFDAYVMVDWPAEKDLLHAQT